MVSVSVQDRKFYIVELKALLARLGLKIDICNPSAKD